LKNSRSCAARGGRINNSPSFQSLQGVRATSLSPASKSSTGNRCGSFSRREPIKKLIEIFQGRIDRVGLVHGRGDGFQGFIAVAGDADYDGFIAWNAPGLDEFFCDGDFGASRGFGENSFGAR